LHDLHMVKGERELKELAKDREKMGNCGERVSDEQSAPRGKLTWVPRRNKWLEGGGQRSPVGQGTKERRAKVPIHKTSRGTNRIEQELAQKRGNGKGQLKKKKKQKPSIQRVARRRGKIRRKMQRSLREQESIRAQKRVTMIK